MTRDLPLRLKQRNARLVSEQEQGRRPFLLAGLAGLAGLARRVREVLHVKYVSPSGRNWLRPPRGATEVSAWRLLLPLPWAI